MLQLLQRRFAALLLLITLVLTMLSTPALAQSFLQEFAQQPGKDPFARMLDAVVDTGVKPNQTPALIQPAFTKVFDADLSMESDEPVFLAPFFPDGIMRIYPQRIMVWHEVVNDFLDDNNQRPIAITYCPVTGSLAAYDLRVGNKIFVLGVFGSLLNNNSILYDSVSQSLWPQITGQCIDGNFKGKILTRLPLLWTTWGRAKAAYPSALVLSRNTGHTRNYGRDPYGSYLSRGNYYDNNLIVHPVMNNDKRQLPKEKILGIEFDGMSVAVLKSEVKKAGVVNFSLGITPLVAMYDPVLDTVRVFTRNLPGDSRTFTFAWTENNMVDNETHTEWDSEGLAFQGTLRGKKLTPVIAIDCMWFAWAAFYPQTRIVPGPGF